VVLGCRAVDDHLHGRPSVGGAGSTRRSGGGGGREGIMKGIVFGVGVRHGIGFADSGAQPC